MTSHLRASDLERLPFEIRRYIYQDLLHVDEKMDELDLSILRINKKIHDEAAEILYGEKQFNCRISDYEPKMRWYRPSVGYIHIACRYYRLIKHISLRISHDRDKTSFRSKNAYRARNNLKASVHEFVNKLFLNDLNTLEVEFRFSDEWNAVFSFKFPSCVMLHFWESCLEPLKKFRALKCEINGLVSPVFAAALEVVIEGPKDEKFITPSQNIDEDESIFAGLEEGNNSKITEDKWLPTGRYQNDDDSDDRSEVRSSECEEIKSDGS